MLLVLAARDDSPEDSTLGSERERLRLCVRRLTVEARRAKVTDGHMKRIDFYFDYASPFSYLAAKQLPSRLPGVHVEPRPIYLRGLETFSKAIPYVGAKLTWIARDLLRCAEYAGVPLRIPSTFPVNGLHGVRGALFAIDAGVFDAYDAAVWKATWVDDRDVSQKQVVLEVIEEAGLDRAAFAAALEDPAIKDRLKRQTEHAVERGVFGVPTMFVGDELFWGQDRLDHVARALGV